MSRRRSPSVALVPDRTSASHWPATLLLTALLALMAARTMISEPTFHRSGMAEAGAFSRIEIDGKIQTADKEIYRPFRVIRVVSACVILALATTWVAVAAARPNGRPLRHPVFAAGLILLAICLLISALRAPDRREGLITAIEQISLVAAAMLAIQCARAAWQRLLVLVVLAALATTLGLKGIYQAYVEIPEQVAFFDENRPEGLAGLGHAADSPEAASFETRMREQTTKGFWFLANVFGSLMVLITLAAAGVATDKWLAARRDARDAQSVRGPPAKRGEIPLPILAAAISTVLVLPAVCAWWLTESIGAIASGVAAAVAAVVLYRYRHWAGRHRRGLLGAAVIGFVVLTAGVAVVGVSRGGLPMRTLQVRWEYWTGSAAMLGERPVWGVGPGNFPDAYLAHRPLGAEEAVKNPHNVIVQALTEYGVLAGGLYLALLAWILVKLAAPQRDDPDPSPTPPAQTVWLMVGCVGIGAIGWRIATTTYPSLIVAAVDNFLPIVALAIGLAAALWVGRPGRTALSDTPRFAACALACGLGGFALHNLSDFALFKPGAAMVFWVAAGTLAAGKRGRDVQLPTAARIGVVILGAAGVLATCVCVLRPVWQANRNTYAAAVAYSTGRPGIADAHLSRAVKADPIDGMAAFDLAGLLRSKIVSTGGTGPRRTLAEAITYADIACERQPHHVTYRERHLSLSALRFNIDLLGFAWVDPPGNVDARRAQTAEDLGKSPDHPVLLNVAAQLAYAAGDYAAAERDLKRAIHVTRGETPILHDRLGDVYYRMGRLNEAYAQWQTYRAWTSTIAGEAEKQLTAEFDQLAAMDPHEPYRRLRTAHVAYHLGLPTIARRELAAARAAEAALWPGSVMRFNERRQGEIRLLETKLAAAPTAPPGP